MIRIKIGWKHYKTVDRPEWEPQVGRGLFGIRLLILQFKFQFSETIKSSIFHIFLNLTYPLRKKYIFTKIPKNHPKIYTKPPYSGWWNKHRDLALLETLPRYWQKGCVKRRRNSLHVYPRLNSISIVYFLKARLLANHFQGRVLSIGYYELIASLREWTPSRHVINLNQ